MNRNVGWIVAIAPLLWLASIGIRTRATVPPPDLAQDLTQDAGVYAQYGRLLDHGQAKAPEAQAKRWVLAWQSGSIKALEPTEYGDVSTFGPRAQVRSGVVRLIERLRAGVRAGRSDGDASGAAELAMLAAELGETAKYFDLSAVYAVGLYQRQALGDLADL